jgi:hypothetical protein
LDTYLLRYYCRKVSRVKIAAIGALKAVRYLLDARPKQVELAAEFSQFVEGLVKRDGAIGVLRECINLVKLVDNEELD